MTDGARLPFYCVVFCFLFFVFCFSNPIFSLQNTGLACPIQEAPYFIFSTGCRKCNICGYHVFYS